MKRLLRWILRLFPEDLDGLSRSVMEETFLDAYAASGFSRSFAVRELWSLIRSGAGERISTWVRDLRSVGGGGPALIAHEVRLASRSLVRSPGFAGASILTIALGIGATTVVFSFVHGILLTPLPYREPARLVALSTFSGGSNSVSEPEFVEFRERARNLASVAAAEPFNRTVEVDGAPRRVQTLAVTQAFFQVLGVSPVLGRAFVAGEDAPGAERVAVVGHSLWMEMFGGDPRAVGSTLLLDGQPYEVVGIMPRGFFYPDASTTIWTPYPLDLAALDRWNNHHLSAVARIAEGASLADARAEVRALGQRMVAEHGEFLQGLGFTSDLVPLTESMVGATRTPLMVLLVAVSLLLLIGCVNVASLLVARGESRRHEAALRAALGASRVRQGLHSLAESLVLAGAGGVAGVGLAWLGVRSIRALVGAGVPRIETVSVDLRVLLFSAAVTLLTGLVFGLLPAAGMGWAHVRPSLGSGGRGASSSRRARAVRRALVAAEVALSVSLVVGAGVMLRSVAKLYGAEPGFRTADVLTLRISLPREGRSAVDPSSFYEALETRVAALPGVSSVGAVERLPLAQPIGLSSIQLHGREVARIGDAPIAEAEQVTPGYFATMGLRLLSGRFLTGGDGVGGSLAVVVNQAFVDQLLSGQEAIGQQIRFFSASSPWLTIVGVVGNERHSGLSAPVRPKFYIPLAQVARSRRRPSGTMTLVVHGTHPEGLAGPIRALVHEMSSAAPVDQVATMASVKAASMTDRSYPTMLLVAFGLLALLLASVGVYGMVAFDAQQRRRDIGVRVAVGATSSGVLRTLVGGSLVPVGVGIAVGLGVAVALTRMLGSLLYGVSALDLPVFLGVPGILLAVSVAASLVPAWRASRCDPAEVLRGE